MSRYQPTVIIYRNALDKVGQKLDEGEPVASYAAAVAVLKEARTKHGQHALTVVRDLQPGTPTVWFDDQPSAGQLPFEAIKSVAHIRLEGAESTPNLDAESDEDLDNEVWGFDPDEDPDEGAEDRDDPSDSDVLFEDFNEEQVALAADIRSLLAA